MDFPQTGDDLAASYRGKGEAGDHFADAEGHLNSEEIEEALHKGKRALELFKKAGTKEGVADAVRVVVKSMIARAKRDEAIKLAKEELESFRKAADKQGEAKVLLAMAEAMWGKEAAKDREEALQCATQARALFTELKNKKMEAAALVIAAYATLVKEGDKESKCQLAITTATKAKELCQEADYKKGEAEALHAIAAAHAVAGAGESCLEAEDEALDLYLELQSKRMSAYSWLCLSKWNLEQGNHKQALWDAEDALEIFHIVKSPKEKDALAAVCTAYLKAGKLNRARRVALEAEARYREGGDKEAEAAALDCLVKVYNATGDEKRAMIAAEKALALVQDIGDKALEATRLATLASVHFGLGNLAQATQMGQDALLILRETGESADKVDAMITVFDLHCAQKDEAAALAMASDMQKHFQEASDAKGEASSLLLLCAVHFAQENYDQAATAVTRAQVMLNGEGDTKGEGFAMRWLCEVQAAKKEHKAAVKVAERGRTLFRELGDDVGEAAMLYQASQNCVALAAQESARGGASRASKDALDKANKYAKAAVKMARELSDAEELLACALCAQGQVLLLNGKPDEALELTDEAVFLFREAGNFPSEAQALLLSADALRGLKQYTESKEAADECMKLFKDQENEKGEEMAQQILSWLEEAQRPSLEEQQRMQWMQQQQWMAQQAQAGGGVPMNLTPIQQQVGQMDAPVETRSVARGPRGPALDMSAGLEEAVVRAKVLEIAERITGAEEGEIEADTPLMEAGLTSNSAILMRDELSQELPGINLPVTLVFDYPSITDMAQLIVESSKSKALK